MKFLLEELENVDNPAVIFRGIVGSHAYGTANAQSDTDIRGLSSRRGEKTMRMLARISTPSRNIVSIGSGGVTAMRLAGCSRSAANSITTRRT